MTKNTLKTIRIAGSDAVPLSGSDPVQLTCGTAGCSSNCCKNGPHIILNPYEIDRICKAGGMSYDDLLDIVVKILGTYYIAPVKNLMNFDSIQ